MKGVSIGCLFTILSLSIGYSQNIGDFQSRQSGNWSLVASWERWDGNAWIGPAPSVPTGAAGVNIVIQSTHIITSNQ
jgi:hypothetical protein